MHGVIQHIWISPGWGRPKYKAHFLIYKLSEGGSMCHIKITKKLVAFQILTRFYLPSEFVAWITVHQIQGKEPHSINYVVVQLGCYSSIETDDSDFAGGTMDRVRCFIQTLQKLSKNTEPHLQNRIGTWDSSLKPRLKAKGNSPLLQGWSHLRSLV